MTLLAILDTETTGVNPERGDMVVQFASLIVDLHDGVEYVFNENVNPMRLIPAEATQCHGITDEMVAECRTFDRVLKEYLDDIQKLGGGRDLILCGHNIQFDLRFLRRVASLPPHLGVICTLQLARSTWPKISSHKLSDVYRRVMGGKAIHHVNAHDALADCLMCWSILEVAKSGSTGMEDYLRQLIHKQRQPVRIEIMPFGKYKGVQMDLIDLDYFRWALNNMENLDRDLRHSMIMEVKERGGR